MTRWPALFRLGLAAGVAASAAAISCRGAEEEIAPAPQLAPCPRSVDSPYIPRSERDGGGEAMPSEARSAQGGDGGIKTSDIVAASNANPKRAPVPSTRARTPWKPKVRAENAAVDPTCGGRDNPCPLQRWMRINMAPALAAKDGAALARALERTATFSPDSSWQWATISKAAADAAKNGDIETARKSCVGCHVSFKAPYKAKYRTRPAK